ncbi:hypothetical protein ACFL13_00255 [Patescibacteria group bacterium]
MLRKWETVTKAFWLLMVLIVFLAIFWLVTGLFIIGGELGPVAINWIIMIWLFLLLLLRCYTLWWEGEYEGTLTDDVGWLVANILSLVFVALAIIVSFLVIVTRSFGTEAVMGYFILGFFAFSSLVYVPKIINKLASKLRDKGAKDGFTKVYDGPSPMDD